MRRLKNLENNFYHRKYKEIYKILFLADLDEISDHSNWYKNNPGYVEKNRPLWIIVESKIINKRIWITQDFGDLEICTAQLDLDVKTPEYSESYTFARFKNQTELVNYLKKLIEPCLDNTIEQNTEDNEEEL